MNKPIKRPRVLILLMCILAFTCIGCANTNRLQITNISQQDNGKADGAKQKNIIKLSSAEMDQGLFLTKTTNQAETNFKASQQQKPIKALSVKTKHRIIKKLNALLAQKNRTENRDVKNNSLENHQQVTEDEPVEILQNLSSTSEEEYAVVAAQSSQGESPQITKEQQQPSIKEPIMVTETPTPVIEEQAAVTEAPVPVVEEPAPVTEEPAPIIATPVPVKEEPVQQSAIPNWALGTPEAGWNGWVVSDPESWTQNVNAGHMICYPTGDLSWGATKYFAGHNPGIMSYLSWIEVGSIVTLSNEGFSRNYRIIDTQYYPHKSSTGVIHFSGIQADLWEMMNGESDIGDSIVIQFCKNGSTYFGLGLPV